MSREPRVDAYIQKAAPFAQPILRELREAVHAACPDAAETIKWGMPFFDYRGRAMCMMAAFKAHAAFGFWGSGRGGDEGDDGATAGAAADKPSGAPTGMGQYGRLTSLADLPPRNAFASEIRAAMARIESGAKPVRKPKPAAVPSAPPNDLTAALAATPAAQAGFAALTPSQRKDHIAWITDAKRAETRAKRVAQAVELAAEGKDRNWRYKGVLRQL